MTSKVLELIKSGGIVVPKILLQNYKKLKITNKELVLIIYLLGNQEFNPKKIANDISLETSEVLELIDSLSNKDIVKIISNSDEKLLNEYISLDEMYNKLALIVINNKQEPKKTTIYDSFEQEFGRTLSPMEYEIIGAWMDEGFKEEMIIKALITTKHF